MAARPICFMIMPYGIKATSATDAAAPARIDCDWLWQAAIRPALEDLGYEPVRADQDLGALIIHEMIERLAISDLVVADVSIPNGNVYYEIGIRHAAKSNGCVMISATWAQPLFDVNQMRQLRYALPAERVDDLTAAAIKMTLMAGIPALATGESPFYMVLPGFPDRLDPARASAFRTALEELSAFQAAVTAAREAGPVACRQRALQLRDEYFAGGPVQWVVALELLYLLRDCTDWEVTLEFIERLPANIRNQPIVLEQKALAQSKAGDHITAIGALRELIRINGDTSERRGLLGGRYKKLFSTTADAGQKAEYLDRAIREYDRGMHLDLNDYYPACNLARLYRLRKRKGDDDRARVAAAVTIVACERARNRGGDDPWLKPTLLGAAFDAGDVATARTLADDIRTEGAVKWQLAVTMADLEFAAGSFSGKRAAELEEILDDLRSLLMTK